jgi:RNA polymerase sigma-70 factor (ECF subfamily)
MMKPLDAYLTVRPRMAATAYRVLGDANEAEDVVQEAWLRWQRTHHASVRNPAAFLVTTTIRIALNIGQSARRRHETSTDPQFLEPPESAIRPDVEVERGAAVEAAVLVLLERLPPLERGAFVLREAFAYPYGRIADVLHLQPAHARQLVSRARRRLLQEQSRPVAHAEHRRLTLLFRRAALTGNLTDLEQLLITDAACHSSRACLV